jgi:DNA-directed RNA polymerase subunit RPC12/RpoP
MPPNRKDRFIMPKGPEKQRRMELRKEIGNRVIVPPEPQTIRGPAYLIAHACFRCRKSFKVKPRETRIRCPQCGGEIHWMGRNFEAPKMSDVEQWRKVQALYAHGFRFFGDGSYPHATPLPDRYRDVARFVEENPNHPFRVAEFDKRLLPTIQRSS